MSTTSKVLRFKPSRVKHPIAYTRDFLTKNPFLDRKTAIQKLVSRGVNPATATTQYQVIKKTSGSTRRR